MAKQEQSQSLMPDQDLIDQSMEGQFRSEIVEDTLIPDYDQATESVADAGVPQPAKGSRKASEGDGGTSGRKKAPKASEGSSDKE